MYMYIYIYIYICTSCTRQSTRAQALSAEGVDAM